MNGETVATYTFNNRFKLKPDHEVTVWASGSGDKVQNPPSDVVSRDTDSWGSGDSTETLLVRTDGEVCGSLLYFNRCYEDFHMVVK